MKLYLVVKEKVKNLSAERHNINLQNLANENIKIMYCNQYQDQIKSAQLFTNNMNKNAYI